MSSNIKNKTAKPQYTFPTIVRDLFTKYQKAFLDLSENFLCNVISLRDLQGEPGEKLKKTLDEYLDTLEKIEIQKLTATLNVGYHKGYDDGIWEKNKQYVYILQTFSGNILEIFDREPSQAQLNAKYKEYLLSEGVKENEIGEENWQLIRWNSADQRIERVVKNPKSQYQWDLYK